MVGVGGGDGWEGRGGGVEVVGPGRVLVTHGNGGGRLEPGVMEWGWVVEVWAADLVGVVSLVRVGTLT